MVQNQTNEYAVAYDHLRLATHKTGSKGYADYQYYM